MLYVWILIYILNAIGKWYKLYAEEVKQYLDAERVSPSNLHLFNVSVQKYSKWKLRYSGFYKVVSYVWISMLFECYKKGYKKKCFQLLTRSKYQPRPWTACTFFHRLLRKILKVSCLKRWKGRSLILAVYNRAYLWCKRAKHSIPYTNYCKRSISLVTLLSRNRGWFGALTKKNQKL